MIYNRFNREISCHRVTVSPNQSVICLAPCHQTSQSFALSPATKAVSHLTCPLPLHHRITAPLHHHVTMLLSHLPCPLPPNKSVICLAPCHQTSQSFDLPSTTASPHHRITASLGHCVTVLFSHLPCPWHQTSQSFDLPSTTTSLHHCITKSPHHHVSQSFTLPPATKPVICLAPCHQTSQSFDLPPATKPVSHLTCPLPPHHRATTSLCHRVLVSHLPCPLPPNKSFI